MHSRIHQVEVSTCTVPSGFVWYDPRDDTVKDETITIFVSTHEQNAKKVREDTKPSSYTGLWYDWAERRDFVIKNAGENAKEWVQPYGFVEAWEKYPRADEKVILGAAERKAELDYLSETQCILHKYKHEMGDSCVPAELAPEWKELEENGISALPLQRKYAMDDIEFGETVSDEDAESILVDMTLLGIKDGHRVEEYLRERDYIYMQNGFTSRYRWVVKDGKRGIIPVDRPNKWAPKPKVGPPELMIKHVFRMAKKNGSIPSIEELEARDALLEEYAARKEVYGRNWRNSLITPDGWSTIKVERILAQDDPERLAIASEYEKEEYEASRPKMGDPCPDSCEDGRIITAIWFKPGQKSNELIKFVDYDDCPTCNGRGAVMAALGFSQDIWEGVEWLDDPVVPTIDDSFWELDFESITK